MSESLSTTDGRSSLHMERLLPDPPAVVWRALTDPALLDRWFPAQVRTAGFAAGAELRYAFRGGEGPDALGVVTAYEEPRLLVQTWGPDELRWELTPGPLGADPEGGTRLVLTHLFDDRPAAASFAAGWHQRLAALPAALRGAEPPAAGDVYAHHESLVAPFGLDEGTSEETSEGWRVRFERQLTRPAEAVWSLLLGGVRPEVGGPVPSAFTTKEFPPGALARYDRPHELAYHWECEGRHAGEVVWRFTAGTGHGARLVLTQSGDAAYPGARVAALRVWRGHIEDLARRVLQLPPG
jgi:uncharacterized protein YndB with AHSA1/START domain